MGCTSRPRIYLAYAIEIPLDIIMVPEKPTITDYYAVYDALFFYGIFSSFESTSEIYNKLLDRICSDEFEHLTS